MREQLALDEDAERLADPRVMPELMEALQSLQRDVPLEELGSRVGRLASRLAGGDGIVAVLHPADGPQRGEEVGADRADRIRWDEAPEEQVALLLEPLAQNVGVVEG
jgi:hypothetical protein